MLDNNVRIKTSNTHGKVMSSRSSHKQNLDRSSIAGTSGEHFVSEVVEVLAAKSRIRCNLLEKTTIY